MGTYNLPRNVKGEGRILFIFSAKALVYTFIGVCVGLIFYLIFSLVNLSTVGIVIVGVLGLLGFIIGTFKMPDSTAFEITKKTGGENIDDVITKNKIYVYQEKKQDLEEETKDE